MVAAALRDAAALEATATCNPPLPLSAATQTETQTWHSLTPLLPSTHSVDVRTEEAVVMAEAVGVAAAEEDVVVVEADTTLCQR
jgi:hypothetical protein